jgi:hypothetical protein
MRYDGAIRLHVTGSSQRTTLPEAVIEDLTAERWQTTSIRGTLPVTPAEGPVEILVELMDGERAGWTAHGVITAEETVVKLEGKSAFTPGT